METLLPAAPTAYPVPNPQCLDDFTTLACNEEGPESVELCQLSPIIPLEIPHLYKVPSYIDDAENSLMIPAHPEDVLRISKPSETSHAQGDLDAGNSTTSSDESIDDSDKDPDWTTSENSESDNNNDQVSCSKVFTARNDDNVVPVTLNSEVINEIVETSQDVVREGKEIKFNPRKRVRNTSKWSRNIKKTKLNTGKGYINASGKEVAKKEMKPPCSDKCRLKCASTVPNHEREVLFDSYYKLGDITRQRDFLTKCIIPITPKYQYPREGSKRSLNCAYYFEVNGKKTRVCKTFFLRTLCISDMTTRTALKKLDSAGFVEEDLRGRHAHHKTTDSDVLKGIREHIESIPRIESHYLRAQTSRQYIDGSLNIATLYKLYKEKCISEQKPFAKLSMYTKVFNTEFNIGLFTPKKDQCILCERYKNSSPNEKLIIQEAYDEHQKQKELSRLEKQEDVKKSKHDPKTLVAVYDLQAVLPTPLGNVSSFYYKSKLGTYNFTIYNIGDKHGTCYVWHEGIAHRGSNEIGSFVFHYLKEHCLGKENVIFYSDNCCGQNKNKYVCAMYLYAVNVLGIDTITHNYLITGHTQNEGDNMHSTIEKEKNRMLKSSPVFVPAQWVPIIGLSKKTGKPYTVNQMQTSDVYDLKKLTAEVGRNFTCNTNGEKVNWNKIKVLKFERKNSGTILYKTDYADKTFSEINVRQNNRGKQTMTRDIVLQPAFATSPPIPAKKKADLLSLCKDLAIPTDFHQFYSNLPATSIAKPVNPRSSNTNEDSE